MRPLFVKMQKEIFRVGVVVISFAPRGFQVNTGHLARKRYESDSQPKTLL